jgi:hypothetical protein
MKNAIIHLLLQTIVICSFSINTKGNENPILCHAIALKNIKNVEKYLKDTNVLKITVDDENFSNQLSLILSYYSSNKENVFDDFINSKNPFIELTGDLSGLSDNRTEPFNILTFSKSLSSVNISNIAFGITDFLIDRTKTELNIAFFNQFKDEMNKDKYKNLQVLFPETAKILMVIGDQMYYYNNYIQSLRNAFETDLNKMPHQIRKWIELNKTNIDDSVYKAINVGLITTTSIIEQKHPGAILDHLSKELKSKEKDDDKVFNTFKNTVYLSALISESFRDTLGSDDYWVNKSKINELYKDEVLLRIYLGLLYQQIKLDSSNLEIKFNENLTLSGLLDSIGKSWKDHKFIAKRLINNVSTQIKMTQNSVARFKETKESVNANDNLTNRERNQAMFNAYYDVTSSLLDILKNMCLEMSELDRDVDKIKPNLEKKLLLSCSNSNTLTFLDEIENIFKIGIYTYNKQYAGAISYAFQLLKNSSQLDKNKLTQLERLISEIDSSNLSIKLGKIEALKINESNYVLSKDNNKKFHYSEIVNSIKELKEEDKYDEKKIEKLKNNCKKLSDNIKQAQNNKWQPFLKYGTFMANMVTAETPEQITDAIEAVAAPPGSFSIKNNSKFSIAFNGYLGLFGGQEYIKEKNNALNLSISAPVGLSFNWKSCSILLPTGVFISIFDLGLLASYRLSDNEKISVLPTVKLNNIISPGIFLEKRLGSSPLTLGFGGQISPQIREEVVEDEMGIIIGKQLITEELYKRMGITLKVDIPILYLKK